MYGMDAWLIEGTIHDWREGSHRGDSHFTSVRRTHSNIQSELTHVIYSGNPFRCYAHASFLYWQELYDEMEQWIVGYPAGFDKEPWGLRERTPWVLKRELHVGPRGFKKECSQSVREPKGFYKKPSVWNHGRQETSSKVSWTLRILTKDPPYWTTGILTRDPPEVSETMRVLTESSVWNPDGSKEELFQSVRNPAGFDKGPSQIVKDTVGFEPLT